MIIVNLKSIVCINIVKNTLVGRISFKIGNLKDKKNWLRIFRNKQKIKILSM